MMNLPWAPLLAYVLARVTVPERHRPFAHLAAAYDLLGISREQAYRWRNNGLSVWTADRIACRLGLHPVEIWGRSWWETAA